MDWQVTVDISEALFNGLADGAFDFILARFPEEQDLTELQYERACEEHTQIIARTDHPKACDQPVSLVDLSSYPWIIQAYRSLIRETVNNALVEAGDSALCNVLFTNCVTTITACLGRNL